MIIYNTFTVVDKVGASKEKQSWIEYKRDVIKILSTLPTANFNSLEQLKFIDFIRSNIIRRTGTLTEQNKIKEANELIALLDFYASPKKYPYYFESIKSNYDMSKNELNKSNH